jgi:hypothetical protein
MKAENSSLTTSFCTLQNGVSMENLKRELLLSCWASSRQDTDNENIDRVCYLQFQVGMHRILIWPDILFPNFTGIQTCNSIFFLRFVNGFTWFVFGYPDTGTGI